MTQVFSKPINNTPRRLIGHEELAFEGHLATNPLAMPVPCTLCIDAASKPIPPYEPNVSSLTGHAPHPTDLVKPDILGEFFCVTAGKQVGIVSNKTTANEYMDVKGSSGQRFPSWEEARAYYTAHYHWACMHIIPPMFPPRVPTPPPKSSTKKKSKTVKSPKTVKSTTPSTCRRRRRRDSSASSGHKYHPLYDDDDPVPPVVVTDDVIPPAVAAVMENQAPPLPVVLSPGTIGNPIEVASNFPTPVTHQETPKRHKKAQRLGLGSAAPISPTPASASLPAILTQLSESRKQLPHISADRFVYVCDCSDEEGGYSAPRIPSLKRKALNNASASGSNTRQNEVIEIHTDSDTDSEICPVTRPCFCKCAALKSFLSSCDGAADPDLNRDNTNIDMDAIPKIPRPSSSVQV